MLEENKPKINHPPTAFNTHVDDCAVVVLSGGQDSVTCLGIALARFKTVYAIGFDYGQTHAVELNCAKHVCEDHGVPFKLVTLGFMEDLVTTNLIGDGDVNEAHENKPNLPSSFVPNRNALFLTLAHAHAQEVGATHIYTGVCQTDYSGYPDCREVFVTHLQLALNIGYETDITILTPLMNVDKAGVFAIAEEFDFLETVVNHSHTCYNGVRNKKFCWGYGCGECPACKLREAGWEEFEMLEGGNNENHSN